MNEFFLSFLIQTFIFCGLFIFFNLKKIQQKLSDKKYYVRCLLAVLLIQIISIATLKKEVGDVGLFASAGWYLSHHQDIYLIDTFHTQYPFFPFLIFLHVILQKLWELFPVLTFSYYLKLVLIGALHGLGIIIKKFHSKRSPGYARALQLQFVASPIAYFIVIFHGQIDILLLLCLVLALIQFENPLRGKIKTLIGGIFYAMAIAIKTWPVFFGLLIFKQLQNKERRFLVGAVVVIFLFLDIFIYTRLAGSSFSRVLPAVFQAGGPTGIWGITLILNTFSLSWPNYDLLKFAVLFTILELIIIRTRRPIWEQSFLTILALYLTQPKWGIQYLIWILPFIYLIRPKLGENKFLTFTFISICYLFVAYTGTIFGILGNNISTPIFDLLLGFTLWLYCLYLLIDSLKNF